MIALTLAPVAAPSPPPPLAAAALAAAALAVVLLVLVMLARSLLHICRPNEILIFTGRKGGPIIVRPRATSPDDANDPGAGKGRKWRIPIIERVDRMNMGTMSVDIVVRNAYSAGNIPLNIHAVANVKVNSDPRLLRNAIERFLGRSIDEVRTVAQQTLEGALREVLAQLTPEQVNEDRLAFAASLVQSARDDLDKLGLQLDTLKIQNVADDTGYLDSLGRPAIAAALRDAENAENQAMQEIAEAQARARQRSEVARAQSQAATVRKSNELAKLRAELDGQALSVEREAEAAAKTARAQAEQELQRVRGQLERKRLQAEVVIPAEIHRAAEAILAKGEAAPTAEHGKAVAEVLEVTAQVWRALGPQAREIYVIQHLEDIVSTVVAHLQKIDVGEVNILDPGDGSGLSSYAAAYPQTIAAVLRALADTTGVDVPGILSAGARGTPPPAAGTPAPRVPTSPRSLP